MCAVQVLTSCSLASFSLVDSYQSLCKRTLEILPPAFLARLAGLSKAPKGEPGAVRSGSQRRGIMKWLCVMTRSSLASKAQGTCPTLGVKTFVTKLMSHAGDGCSDVLVLRGMAWRILGP